ncbi:uncharacterized protein [Onthophagus taurus]|uniref:uncharacterized protein n=1 Tax=Onthophagus taurus TaxID=166361 RepID=UPI0039BE2C13
MATAREIDLNPIFERQNDIHGLISRTIDNLKKLAIAKRTRGNFQSRLERLEINWDEFNNAHKQLIQYRDKYSDTIYFTEDIFSECEEAYFDAKGTLLDLLNPLPLSPTPEVDTKPVSNVSYSSSRSRHLPKIDLPTFDGKYANWAQFQDLFSTMVNDNEDLTDVERLQYLKVSLTGEPSQLLKNISVTERSPFKSSELKRLAGEIKEAFGALKVLKCPIQHWDYILVYVIVRKLDTDAVKEWERSIGNHRDPSTFDELEDFLMNRIHTLEAVENLQSSRKVYSISTGSKVSSVKAHNAYSPVNGCVMCNSAHYISSCPAYLSKSPAERQDFVISRKLCFNCLGSHTVNKCRVSKRCRVCRKSHHTSLHDAPRRSTSTRIQSSVEPSKSGTVFAPIQEQPSITANDLTVSNHLLHSHHIHAPVLLATALVRIESSRGHSVIVRALIDQGSEVSFITESLVQQLQLPRKPASIPISGIGSQRTSISNGIVTVQLSSQFNPFLSFNEEALILPKLTAYLPQKYSAQLPIELLNLPLADSDISSSKRIDLILGVSLYSKILQNGVKRSSDGSLIAQQTAFGWILSGVLSNQSQSNFNPYGFQCSIDREFADLMQKFWTIEEESSSKPCLSTDEIDCEKHFVNSHSRDSSGRFIVRLPFRKSPRELGNSYMIAVKTFSRSELRFARDESFKTAYSKFMREYLDLDHMRPVTVPVESPNFYLPHHGVIRESSTTTKLRVVFNGSQKTSSGLSLNDCLHTGPKLQSELVDVLLRWRRHPVAFACDLEKMYRQIDVHQDDWQFQRIVWRENPSEPLQSYDLTTVTYGLSCAPYLAIRCIRQLAEEHVEEQPLGSSALFRDTYVDDIISGANDIHEVQELIFQLNRVLTAGGFLARKWISNVSKALAYVPSDLLSDTETLRVQDDNSPRPLVYLRVSKADDVRVSLLFSKTKVAPLKRVTIPRLELCAAVLLVRVIKRVRATLDFNEVPIFLWSDSTVALSWIGSHPSRWKDFVRNRVTEIQELSHVHWCYVPTKENPADLSSRGVSVTKLEAETLWWNGPSWLRSPPSEWPSLRPNSDAKEIPEARSIHTSNTTTAMKKGWDLKLKYSSLNKLLRVTAWYKRFFHKVKTNSKFSDILSPDELNDSLMFWVRECQQLHFSDEIQILTDGRVVPRSSSLFRLSPFIDDKGFLRVTGRLRFSNLDWNEKHPSKRFANYDSSDRQTSSSYVAWRNSTNFIFNPTPFLDRWRASTCPFVHSSMYDLCETTSSHQPAVDGPTSAFKTTSAVHLEVATDYSTSGFLAAYKRFSGRRGISECLYSDCGTNLVGADRELRSMFSAASKEWKEMASLLSGDGTRWKFNPPGAPHFGGKWEAGVKSVKGHLRKIVGSTLLTYEEFNTVLIQIEAVINSRPLCSISDDPNNFDVLTPAHFFIGNALTVVPEPSVFDEKISRRSRWQLLRRMVEDFWKIWEKFYLQSMQNATKWFNQQNLPQIGQLVLIRDERLPPAKWSLARILQIHSGADGHARVATLKTANSTLVRPFAKLSILPDCTN